MSAAPEEEAEAAQSSAVAAPQLRPDVLDAVFSRGLRGRIDALCAAACVCTSWRAAAADARLWRRLLALRARAARRCTDARLLALVARAGAGGLEIDVSGCVLLSGDGLALALRAQPRLAWFAAVGCANLSVADVARALDGRRMTTQCVRGVLVSAPAGDEEEEDDDTAARLARNLALLRSFVEREEDLDATTQCCAREDTDEEDDEWLAVCGGLCGAADRVCDFCDAFRCTVCVRTAVARQALPFRRCEAFGARVCTSCAEEEPLVADACSFCTRLRCARCLAAGAGTALVHCGVASCEMAACATCMRDGQHIIVKCAARVRDAQGRARRHASCMHFFCITHAWSETCKSCSCRVCAECVRNVSGLFRLCPVRPGASRMEPLCKKCRRERAAKAAAQQLGL
jgi:hypothetical protein